MASDTTNLVLLGWLVASTAFLGFVFAASSFGRYVELRKATTRPLSILLRELANALSFFPSKSAKFEESPFQAGYLEWDIRWVASGITKATIVDGIGESCVLLLDPPIDFSGAPAVSSIRFHSTQPVTLFRLRSATLRGYFTDSEGKVGPVDAQGRLGTGQLVLFDCR